MLFAGIVKLKWQPLKVFYRYLMVLLKGDRRRRRRWGKYATRAPIPYPIRAKNPTLLNCGLWIADFGFLILDCELLIDLKLMIINCKS